MRNLYQATLLIAVFVAVLFSNLRVEAVQAQVIGAFAIPNAEFKADPSGGIAPFTVTFTDLSTGDPSSWAWKFGDGDSSSEQNPTHVYKTEGNFNVSLQACNSDGCDTAEKTNLISATASSSCNADFKSDTTSGFAPLEITFTDLSIGTPSSWTWDFGDGGVSSDQNPAYVYNVGGMFSVSLEISGECGIDKETKANFINVQELPKPTAEFNASPTSGIAPLDVQFNNISTGDPSSFVWTFGDGGTSSDKSPKHEYKTAGIFTVSMVAGNQAGSDIETKINLINVQGGQKPIAEFKASPLSGFAPLKTQFTDLSSGNIAGWAWNFGDGATSNLSNPVHNFLHSGFYNVELIVSGEDGTGLETKTNLVNILEGEGLTAAFKAEPLSGNVPFTVSFFNQSSGAATDYLWDFGDGETSNEVNPTHIYEKDGKFNVKLTISNEAETAIESKEDFITATEGQSPNAGFAASKQTLDDNLAIGSPASGLRIYSDFDDDSDSDDDSDDDADIGSNELKVKFTDLSSSPSGEIINREWDFGDGTKSSEKNPEHTFKGEPGQAFTVSLTAQNSNGIDSATKPAFISLSGGILPGFVKGKATNAADGKGIEGAGILLKQAAITIGSIKTSGNGAYFIQIPPGDYTFLASKKGFQDFLEKISVLVDDTTVVNARMKLPETPTPTPEPTATETPAPPGKIATLTATPPTAGKSFRLSRAIVIAQDEGGKPLKDMDVNATAQGGGLLTPIVKPTTASTNDKGEAFFEFRFPLLGRGGLIVFTADGIKATIKQVR